MPHKNRIYKRLPTRHGYNNFAFEDGVESIGENQNMSDTPPRKYPPEFRPIDWNTMVDFYNGFTPTGSFKSAYNFLITYDSTYYYASNAFQTIYGGASDAGGVSGASLLAVTQACINYLTDGLIILLNLDEPGGLTYKDGVVLVSHYSGISKTHFTNPTAEVASLTNTENAVCQHILSKPTGDTASLAAWCALTSEIEAPTGASKSYVAGYFGAICPSGSGGFIWGINPLVWLSAGSTGNAIAAEVDVNNFQVDDKGEGVTIVTNTGFNPYTALKVSSTGTARFNRGIELQKWNNYGILIVDDQTGAHQAIAVQYTIDKSGVPFNVVYNNNDVYSLAQTDGAVGLYSRNFSGGIVDVLAYYTAGDAQALFRVNSNGVIVWGTGGSTVEDCDLYRQSANLLKTDDQLYCVDGVATKVKAGTISDADLTNTTVTGILAVDTSNNRIYFRTGTATWHYCQATAGFGIPKEEKTCGVCGKPIVKGEFVCGQIEGEMDDGALHGLWVHLKCAAKE
jgi:hypothetical protein